MINFNIYSCVIKSTFLSTLRDHLYIGFKTENIVLNSLHKLWYSYSVIESGNQEVNNTFTVITYLICFV